MKHIPTAHKAGPLSGVRILDLTSVIMGPFATQIGADVIKVETREGDNMRHVGPMAHPGMGQIFLHANSGKRSVVLARGQTGEGQAVAVPMFETMAQFILGDHMAGLTFDPQCGEPGYARLLTPHRKPYATRDGMLCVLIYNDKHWRSFFEAIGESNGLSQDARFASHSARAENIDTFYAEVSRVMRARTTAEWRTLLNAADVPNMPMNSPADLLVNPQLRATGFVKETMQPSEGTIYALAHPTRWSGTPPEREFDPALRLGEHTWAVLRETGYSAEQIERMEAKGVCGVAPAQADKTS